MKYIFGGLSMKKWRVGIIGVGGIFPYWILHLQNGGVVAFLGIYHADAIHFLYAEINILEDLGSLSSSAERTYGNSHTYEDGNENDRNEK